jgi:hypothetical protein
MNNLIRLKINSSNIKDAVFDPNDDCLYIRFHWDYKKDIDRIYCYNCPADLVSSMEKAESAGQFFNEAIKPFHIETLLDSAYIMEAAQDEISEVEA